MDKSAEFTGKNEDYRQFTYQCTANKNTIGYGFNLDDVGLSKEESQVILEMRLYRLEVKLRLELPWFDRLTEARKAALKDMAYQMGLSGLLGFKMSLRLMASGDYPGAAKEFLHSKWAKQTPNRAARVTCMIERGKFV